MSYRLPAPQSAAPHARRLHLIAVDVAPAKSQKNCTCQIGLALAAPDSNLTPQEVLIAPQILLPHLHSQFSLSLAPTPDPPTAARLSFCPKYPGGSGGLAPS